MRLLVIDPHGDGLDVAVRAQRDGHEVRYFVRPHKKTEHIGQGFVHVTGDFRTGCAGRILFLRPTTLCTCETCRRLATRVIEVSLPPRRRRLAGKLTALLGKECFESMVLLQFHSDNLTITTQPSAT